MVPTCLWTCTVQLMLYKTRASEKNDMCPPSEDVAKIATSEGSVRQPFAPTAADLLMPGLSMSSATPKHVQLADLLREKIYSKQWAVSSRIPSEHDLMSLFGVSRGTVRRAIKSLVDEGLLVQRHGRGTFVAKPEITHPAGMRPLSFAESLKQQGKDYVTHVIERRVTKAPADVARELGLETTDNVLLLRRLRTVDGEPVLCQESWSNLRACPGLDEVDYATTSMFDAVEMCSGKKIRYSDMRYRARVAGKEHGRMLGCEESAAVLVLEQNIHLENGVAIEWSSTWLTPGQAIVSKAYQPE